MSEMPKVQQYSSLCLVSARLLQGSSQILFHFIIQISNEASNKAGGINRIPQWAHNTTLAESSNKSQPRHVNASVQRRSKIKLAVVATKDNAKTPDPAILLGRMSPNRDVHVIVRNGSFRREVTKGETQTP